jgi:hypothetical protein
MAVTDRDLGWEAIKREVERAQRREVAVGILQGSTDSEGTSIAEYATYNEFGTGDVPSRPFMAMSFDENVAAINSDFNRQSKRLVAGEVTAEQALTIIGQKHAGRVQNTITGRNILPALAPSTIAAKKGSTKTLVDTGAMVNAVQIEIRGRT